MTMMVDNPFKAGYFVAFWGVGPLDSHELVVEDFFGVDAIFSMRRFFLFVSNMAICTAAGNNPIHEQKRTHNVLFLFWVFQTLQKSQTLGIPCKT